MYPFYIVRLLGGTLFFLGTFIMAYNVWKTIAGAKPADTSIPQPAHA
jgi:cytochrome c oxidase cbb3-type subunit 1